MRRASRCSRRARELPRSRPRCGTRSTRSAGCFSGCRSTTGTTPRRSSSGGPKPEPDLSAAEDEMTETLTPVRPGKLLINGEAVDAASGKTYTTFNPATEEPICTVAEAGPEDVDRAVRAARAAFEGPWSRMKPAERQKILWRLGDLILEHGDEIARLETLDNGKPIFESRQIDVPMAANCFHYFAGWTTKLAGETLPVSPSFFTFTLREPLGVVGAIVPWNFPMIMVGWKAAPALAAGNTVVLKPAEITPLT